MGGVGSMRFPVFVVGLIICSVGVGVMLWLSGMSGGKSALWALLAFFVGQLLYVAVIGLLAAVQAKKTPKPPKREAADTAAIRTGAQLSSPQDRQG